MTSPLLYDQDPPDVEDVIIAWLTPVRADTAAVYMSGDPLPFTLVRHIGGSESIDENTTDFLVQVETLCDRTAGWVAARDEARKTRRRIGQLQHLLEPFVLPDGTGVGVDYCQVVESPIWMNFENERIIRKVGRYQIGLMYSPTP